MDMVRDDQRVLVCIFREQRRAGRRWIGGRRRLKDLFGLIDIFSSDVAVDDARVRSHCRIGQPEIHAAPLQACPDGDIVGHRPGFHLPLQNGLKLIVDPQFAGASIVVNVIVPRGAEEIRCAAVCAGSRVVAAVRPGNVVVNQRMAKARGNEKPPVRG